MRLPYNRNRTYLSGIDWIIATIDFYMKKTSNAGNHSTLIIQLKNKISTSDLKERVSKIHSSIPILSSEIRRDFVNLAPYWKKSKKSRTQPLVIENKIIDTPSELHNLSKKILNTAFSYPDRHLVFNTSSGKIGNYLFMTFDHKVFDARGAELFLNLLEEHSEDTIDKLLKEIKVSNSPKLINWKDKFDAGKDIQRSMIEMSKTPCYSPINSNIKKVLKSSQKSSLDFKTITYSEETTTEILINSEKLSGFMMETNFFLAAATDAIDKAINANNGASFNIPMPVDMRKSSKSSLDHLLLNHLSFIFLNIQKNPNDSIKILSRKFKKALFEQVELELPEKLILATRLARICPLSFLYKFMKLHMNGNICSFAFANVGKNKSISNILNSEIVNITHLPRVPTPPGIGLFFNNFAGKLNFSITWDVNKVEKKSVDAILRHVDENLKKE